MTNSGMFDDPEKIEYLENQNKLLKGKLKEAASKIKRIDTLEKHHLKNNGDLRVENRKLEKEIQNLKKQNEVIQEGNDYLGIYSGDLINEIKKLSDDMTGAVEAGSVLVKKNKKNIMFMTSIKGLIRYTQRITAIYKKIRKN
ncbi:hypothetical protein [uncultured Mediterranean phage uvMED]|nr:hypothetical protein [uncultured Mediterranean phage uvMED]